MLPNFSLAGKKAIVTGASRGIGKDIALAFAEAGADVAICSRQVADGQLEAVARQIRQMGRQSIAVQADTSSKKDIEYLVQKTLDEFGAIDNLVNNAGIIIRSPILEISEENWDRLFNVDLKGYLLCAQAVSKKMMEQKKGNIINISSQHAFKTTPGMGAYAIAKAGVVMLTRVLAQELGKYGVRANCIAPGLVKTEFSRVSWTNPDFVKQREAALPLGRLAETADITGSALFLASEASSYVTGHTILVDGGGLA